MVDNKPEFNAEDEGAKVRDAVMAAPTPGEDPDSQQRLAKQLAALGVDLPDGLSVDPVTEEDRKAYVDKVANPAEKDDDDKQTAAQKRAAAGVSKTATPQGRAATPTQKTAE